MASHDSFSMKRSAANAPKHTRAAIYKQPGRVAGVIAVKPKGLAPGEYNPCVILWTVDTFRKDFGRVLEQNKRTTKLPAYEKELFDSCFKNW